MNFGLCVVAIVAFVTIPIVSGHGLSEDFNAIRFDNIVHSQDDNIKVYASPSLLEQSGDWVVLKYSGVQNPTSDDWIGVFSPSNVDVTKTAPTKYQYANHSSGYLTTGSGVLRFKLFNMHSDVVFAFFRKGFRHPTVAAKSNIVMFKNPEEPLQGHIALTGKPDEMRVMWATGYGAKSQYVEYGTQPGQYTQKVLAHSYTYKESDMCGSPAVGYGYKEPGLLHTVVLSGLQYSTRYFYRYGSDNITGWSTETSFVAPPKPGNASQMFFAAFGDMGRGEEDHSLEHLVMDPSLSTTRHIVDMVDNLDLVLHIGDISYALGYAAQWDHFLEQIRPISSRVPYMTCPGNHERDYPNSNSFFNGTDSGGECGVPYLQRFLMPSPSTSHKTPIHPRPLPSQKRIRTNNHDDKPWYSFDFGLVHFVFMSTEHNFLAGSEQNEWLTRDLESVDRVKTPWVIFSGHRPMYIDSTNFNVPDGDQTVATLLRNNLEDILVKYGVDLAFWGHHHSYQRSCPVYREKCQNSGKLPVHVVIGMAGAGFSQNLQKPDPAWIKYVDDQEHGYSTVTVTPTRIHMQYYGNESGLKDEFFLHK